MTNSRTVRALTSALAGVFLVLFTSQTPDWAIVILAGALLVGLPHGALDHRLAARQWSSWSTLRGQVSFHLTYLLLVAVVLAMWWLTPLAGLLLFLAGSAWHFGESDLMDLSERSTAQVISRGLLLIAAPMLAWPAYSLSLISAVLVDVPALLPLWLGPLLAVGIALAHLWLMRSTPAADQIDAMALSVLLLGGGPIMGVGLYFILWHTPDHFRHLARTFAEQPGGIARSALPRTLGAVVFIVVTALVTSPETWPVLTVQLTAALTIPHALVVHFGLSASPLQATGAQPTLPSA